MPTFKIQGPDGRVMQINAQDGQTAMRVAQQQYAARTTPQRTSSLLADVDPRKARVVDPRQNPVTPFAAPDRAAPFSVGGMVANAVGGQDPAYAKAMAREHDLDRVRPPRGITSQAVAPFMPYVQYAAGYGSQGLQNLVRSATGQGIEIPATTAGQAAADDERAQQAAWEKAHPAQAVLGNVAGAAVLGPARAGTLIRGVPYAPAVKSATSFGQKTLNLLKAMGTGGGIGAAYGAAEAPDGHHLEGGLTGLATGAAMAPVLAGATKVVQKVGAPVVDLVSNRLGPSVTGATVPKAPARQAAAYVARKLGQAGVGGPTLAASTAPTAAEAAGNTGRVSLAALARQGGKTPEAVQDLIQERRAGRPDRILDAISSATGIDPAGARGAVDAIIANGQKNATPLFDAVRATPGPVWNADLADIAQRPAVKDALKMTATALKNQGKDPMLMGLAIDPDTGAFKVAPPSVDPSKDPNAIPLGQVLEPQPTAEAWEYTRQMLGDLGKESPNMSNTQRIQAKGYQAAQRDLTRTLAGDESGEGALIPGYRDALNVAGDYKSVEGAFKNAKGKLFSQKFTPGDFSDMLDGTADSEQNAIRHAMASDIYDLSQNGLLTPNRVKSPAFRAKLTLGFGPEAASRISDTLANEADMAAAENQLYPQAGSQTAPLSAAMKEQQENPLGDFAADAISHTISAGGNPVHGFGMAAVKNAGKLLASGLKTPGMGTEARDEAGRLFMMSPQDLHAYLNSNNFTPNTLKAPPITPLLAARMGGDITGAIMPQPDNDQGQGQPLAVAQ